MERAVSVAVVKPDGTPAIQAVIGSVNVAAAAISAVNPQAGIGVQALCAVAGWAWAKWKYDRVKPVLEETAKRIQGIESAYVRREEFADLLWDTLRRLGDQPSAHRQGLLGNILFNAIRAPQDHTLNRLFLRLADEMTGDELKVFFAVQGEITRDEMMLGNNKILARRAQIDDARIDAIMTDLSMQRVFDGLKFHVRPPPAGLTFLLTATGAQFLRFLRE
jgi:hypothetical protein